jgi:uncharacterized protein (DUF58 family)
MIVPRTRLVFWVAAAFVPFATLALAVPSTFAVSMVFVAVFVAAAIVDAALALGCLDGVGVELPSVVRLTKDRPGEFDLRIRNDRQQPMELRLGLAFPPEIQTEHEDLLAVLPPQSQFSHVTWPCKPVKRGVYMLDKCYLEGASPLGFWAIRTSTPTRAELRVYPNLLGERKNLAALFLHRGNFGIHTQRQVGQGRDFEKLRDYIPGDALNEIHWKATAKRSRPVTKVFQIEKTQEVYVVIDASRLSARESGQSATALERFVTAALVVGLVAEQQGDLFGLLTFSDKVQSFVRAKRGQEHYGVCRDALYTLQPNMVSPDFDSLCTFLRLRLRRRALLLVLTNLDDPILAENFVRHIDLISRQHLVLVNILRPGGAKPMFTDANAETVDDLYQRLGGHVRWHNLRELERVLHRHSVGFAQLDDERLSTDLVTQYINVKRRQLL